MPPTTSVTVQLPVTQLRYGRYGDSAFNFHLRDSERPAPARLRPQASGTATFEDETDLAVELLVAESSNPDRLSMIAFGDRRRRRAPGASLTACPDWRNGLSKSSTAKSVSLAAVEAAQSVGHAPDRTPVDPMASASAEASAPSTALRAVPLPPLREGGIARRSTAPTRPTAASTRPTASITTRKARPAGPCAVTPPLSY
jgi:hypothetical protein